MIVGSWIGRESTQANVLDDEIDGLLELLRVFLIPVDTVVLESGTVGDEPVGRTDRRGWIEIIDLTSRQRVHRQLQNSAADQRVLLQIAGPGELSAGLVVDHDEPIIGR